MLRISDFSRIAQVSTRTLRYYDTLGLLKPGIIDPQSGYRYYSSDQLARLNRILALKDLGFGLEQIGGLLESNMLPDLMRDYLVEQEREIKVRMQEDADRLRRVRERLQQINQESEALSIDVVLKRIEAQPALGNRMIVPTANDLMFFCRHMLTELYQWLRQHRIPHEPEQLILYYAEEYVEQDVDTEVGVLLPTMPRYVPPFPHGAMRLFELPAVPVAATTIYNGRLQNASGTIRNLIRWCEQSGYRYPEGGIMLRELHLFEQSDLSIPIPLEGVVEFQLPLRPPDSSDS